MSLFRREHTQDRLCGKTWGLCPGRSTMTRSGQALSSPHMCGDYITDGETTHGNSTNNQHHCTACASTMYKQK